jgi:hypothetical protein
VKIKSLDELCQSVIDELECVAREFVFKRGLFQDIEIEQMPEERRVCQPLEPDLLVIPEEGYAVKSFRMEQIRFRGMASRIEVFTASSDERRARIEEIINGIRRIFFADIKAHLMRYSDNEIAVFDLEELGEVLPGISRDEVVIGGHHVAEHVPHHKMRFDGEPLRTNKPYHAAENLIVDRRKHDRARYELFFCVGKDPMKMIYFDKPAEFAICEEEEPLEGGYLSIRCLLHRAWKPMNTGDIWVYAFRRKLTFQQLVLSYWDDLVEWVEDLLSGVR